jgi:hypothetical protein
VEQNNANLRYAKNASTLLHSAATDGSYVVLNISQNLRPSSLTNKPQLPGAEYPRDRGSRGLSRARPASGPQTSSSTRSCYSTDNSPRQSQACSLSLLTSGGESGWQNAWVIPRSSRNLRIAAPILAACDLSFTQIVQGASGNRGQCSGSAEQPESSCAVAPCYVT